MRLLLFFLIVFPITIKDIMWFCEVEKNTHILEDMLKSMTQTAKMYSRAPLLLSFTTVYVYVCDSLLDLPPLRLFRVNRACSVKPLMLNVMRPRQLNHKGAARMHYACPVYKNVIMKFITQ